MKVDRYTKVVLTVIALALSALAINYIVAPAACRRCRASPGRRALSGRSLVR